MYQVSLKSEGGRPFFVITWPGITHMEHVVQCVRIYSNLELITLGAAQLITLTWIGTVT